ncbi:MAG: hypothetical protein H0X64_15125 [Gemmatimonadaceae bacterium]|nr:hypothetical protein [Gemmatimonadaceae bacterium]
MEFAPHLRVVSVTAGGAEAEWTLGELLPHAFTPKSFGTTAPERLSTS